MKNNSQQRFWDTNERTKAGYRVHESAYAIVAQDETDAPHMDTDAPSQLRQGTPTARPMGAALSTCMRICNLRSCFSRETYPPFLRGDAPSSSCSPPRAGIAGADHARGMRLVRLLNGDATIAEIDVAPVPSCARSTLGMHACDAVPLPVLPVTSKKV